MNTHYFRSWLPAPGSGEGSRALVAAPATPTAVSQEGFGTRTAIMAGSVLLVGLIIVIAETYFDHLRGHAVVPAASRSK